MKYIRTKTGVYEVTEDLVINKFGHLAKKDDPFVTIAGVGEIVNQSDSIEELCDEFDWKWNKELFPYSTVCQHWRFAGLGDLKRSIREEQTYGHYLNEDYEVYGAIWTDKGLIYVAKMNWEGEFKLL